ncbi:pirin domain-containing protein [Sistotremastrum niveocremeum HHB9708]|uniref:Pirin domain-containing protein n=1 Tax=Sistotremastrum niveocremeum HHB9708 TaxID=1314777 RepID=A0A164VX91_9AGAM|nr:pirin domain-containing protein [Sistotremastrum niveocremeum HHB9708]
MSTAASNSPIQFVVRPSEDRGGDNHGWLKTFHTFSFAGYQDPKWSSFGSLRVLNEDRVEPKTGFGTHSHKEFEIFSYLVSGELEHKDSMGNTEVLKRGDLQMTSAGTGIRHSEHSHGGKQVHFLQIWSVPSTRGLTPKYFTRHFTDQEKQDKLVRIVAPIGAPGVTEAREAEGPAPVHSPLTLFATIISPSKSVVHTLGSKKVHIHVVQTSGYNTGKSSGASIRLNGSTSISEGDAVFGTGEPGDKIEIENTGDIPAEVLVFDLD